MHTRRLSPSLLVLVPILMALSLLSCGRDAESPVTSVLESPSGVAQGLVPPRLLEEGANPPPRSTPAQLLVNYFEQVYARRDSVLYAAMLDRRFEFVFLPQDADSLGTDAWTKRMDLRSTGAMFRDATVTGITLNILLNQEQTYIGDDCEGCVEMQTTITLRVMMDDGSGEPLILAVDSPQTFIVQPDAIQDGKWSIFRQIDRPSDVVRMQDGDAASRVESFSWGQVKGLFYR